MAVKKFNIESLDQIDEGTVALAINKAMRSGFQDCADAPEIAKARKITLEITMIPEMSRGELTYVRTGFVVKKTNPPRGVEVRMRPDNAGNLEFQPSVSENPDQNPLPFEDEPKSKPGKSK